MTEDRHADRHSDDLLSGAGMSVECVCVNPAQVHLYWGLAAPLIRAAMVKPLERLARATMAR